MSKTIRRLRGETGTVAILFAVGMTSFMAFLAIVVEVGLIHAEKTNLQAAADAAALAGVQSLPWNPAQAVLDAQEWAAKNVDGLTFNDAVVVDGQRIEVTVRRNAIGVFNGALSLGKPEVEATASALALNTGVPYAIFGIGDKCSGGTRPVKIEGSGALVTGAVHSNGRIKVSGGSHEVQGIVTYVCDPPDINGSGHDSQGGLAEIEPRPTPLEPPDLAPYFAYLASPATCTFELTGSDELKNYPEFWVDGDPDSNQLLPGVYCSDDDIELKQSNVSGTVTFIADQKVKISGHDIILTAFVGGVLVFSADYKVEWTGNNGQWTGDMLAADGEIKVSGSDHSWTGDMYSADGEIKISGSDATWTGNLFAPNDKVEVTGARATATGVLVGDEVKLNGSDITINYNPAHEGTTILYRLVA